MTATATEAVAGPPDHRTVARKWGPWALLVVVAAVVLAIGLQRGGGPATLDARVAQLAGQLRCPVCHGETVAQSQSSVSVEIRAEIRADLQKGESQGQIFSSLVASYGQSILEKPQANGISVVVWVLPVVAVLLGAVGVVLIVRRWGSGGDPDGSPVAADEIPAPAEDADGAERAGPAPGRSEPARSRPARSRPARSRRTRVVVAVAGFGLVAGGASWAVAASSATRLPGQEITGQSLGSQVISSDIQAATADEDRNNPLGAIKLYQQVLKSEPDQIEALAGEGWLLAQTGQPALLQQGLGLLVRAEQVDPSYTAAHLYRGIALLGEGDYGGAAPELQWYLAHSPDPQLVASVKSALAKARSGLAASSAPTPASTPASTSTTAAAHG